MTRFKSRIGHYFDLVREPDTETTFLIHLKPFFYISLFAAIIIFIFLSIIIYDLFIKNIQFQLDTEGIYNLIELLSSPIKVSIAYLSILAIIVYNHRTKQTAKQIEETLKANKSTAYYKHKEVFINLFKNFTMDNNSQIFSNYELSISYMYDYWFGSSPNVFNNGLLLESTKQIFENSFDKITREYIRELKIDTTELFHFHNFVNNFTKLNYKFSTEEVSRTKREVIFDLIKNELILIGHLYSFAGRTEERFIEIRYWFQEIFFNEDEY
jgi:hypothetical protein